MRDLAIAKAGRLLVICLMMLAVSALVVRASAGACQIPSELLQLARHIAPGTSGKPLSASEAQRLSEVLDGVSERAMVRTLEENGLVSLVPTMLALVTEANKLATGSGEVKGWYVARLLRNLESESVIACQEATGTGYQPDQQAREGGVLNRDKEKPLDWGKIEKTLEQNRPLSLGLLVGSVLAVVGSLFAIDFLVRWIMALVYNRKACRIPASLKRGKVDVHGAVITLGRGGFRFQPDRALDLDLMLEDQDETRVSLLVDDMDMTAVLSRNHGEVADFRFETHLGLAAQKAMLRLSKISPYPIRKSRGSAKAPVEILEELDFEAEIVDIEIEQDDPKPGEAPAQ